MALTVSAAFEKFRKDFVDLDPDEVDTARNSRDFLVEQIYKLPDDDTNFPWLTGQRVLFGSFARRTKIRPLDDIDIMVVMHGGGGTERQSLFVEFESQIHPGTMGSPVRLLCDDAGYINSNRVLFKFRDALSKIPQYEGADLHKRHEAVTLKLKSYPWNFDIVPTFGVTNGYTPLTYYVIPDGKGHWKRTDPRKDDERVNDVNQKHDGLALPTIRLLKYWNDRNQSPTMMSYWLESIALSIFEEINSIKVIRIGLFHFFTYAIRKVQARCPDPKGLGPNLDEDVDTESRQKIVDALARAAKISLAALKYEVEDEDHHNAITEWRKIFGPSFPTYG